MDTAASQPLVAGSAVEGFVTEQPPTNEASPAIVQQTIPASSTTWSNSVWDCFKGDDALCAKAYFIPCVVYGKTQARMRDPFLESYKNCNGDCWCFALLCYAGLPWVLPCTTRRDIRYKYNIDGSRCKDCIMSYCCHCCTLIQQEKEIVHRNAIGDKGNGYAPPSAMSAQPMSEIPAEHRAYYERTRPQGA